MAFGCQKKWMSVTRHSQELMGRYRMLLLATEKYVMKKETNCTVKTWYLPEEHSTA